MKRALADALVLRDHPDVAWQPPVDLPPGVDLRRGVAVFEAQLQRVDRKHAAFCLAKLASGFNERLTKEEAQLRTEVWLEACGHVPNDLWSSGVMDLLQTWQRDKHYGRVPEASDLLAVVKDRMERRQTGLNRCKAMLAKTAQPEKAAGFVQDPADVRLRTMRDSLRRIGKVGRAATYERELAALEGRDVEAWAAGEIPQATVEKAEREPLPPLSPGMQARTLRSVAKSWRAKGNTARAEELEQQADALAPESRDAWRAGEPTYHRDLPSAAQEPPEQRDIPEAAHG